MKSNRENIAKALECCIVQHTECRNCPLLYTACESGACYKQAKKDAVSLIRELTEECKDLEIRALRAENQAGIYRDRWKTSKKDFERLADENETLRGLYEHNSQLAIDADRKLAQCKKSYEDELSRAHMLLSMAWESIESKDKLLGTIKADTVRKMQDKLNDTRTKICGEYYIYANNVDVIAKEMLEENNV